MENKNYIKTLVSDFANTPSDAVAFSIYDSETIKNISYPQFAADILKAAGYFRHQNISEQHVALIAPNSYLMIVSFFAALANHNTVIPMNSGLPASLLKWQLEKADVDVILTSDIAAESLTECKSLYPTILISEIIDADPIALDEIPDMEMDDVAIMLFTSGTMGKSKATQLTLKNIKTTIDNSFDYYKLGHMERTIHVLPLFHIAGAKRLLNNLFYKQTICLGRGIAYMMLDIPIFNPTSLGLVPAMVENFVKLLKRLSTKEEREKYLGTNLKRISIGGAILKTDVIEYLISMGFILDNFYGMTEIAGSGTWFAVEVMHNGSIGKPYGDTECCIQDGELLLKSDAVMKGYYKDPEETAKVIVDGWLHTGDMGYCDEDGYYYITGRKKNVIILSNGENVNPEEIEATFGECEAIEECLVFSDGKGICADIFAKDQAVAGAFIKAYNESMPMYRQVYKVNYTTEPLPKTGSGKIKRKEKL